MPDEPEVAGLLALMLLIDVTPPARASRTTVRSSSCASRTAPSGTARLITEGQELVRACLRRNQPGPYQVQAAINAVHSDAPTAGATDWHQILALYDQLIVFEPSPVVALNRAVALAEVRGSPGRLWTPSTASARVLLPLPRRAGRPAPATRSPEGRGCRRTPRHCVLTDNEAERAFLEQARARWRLDGSSTATQRTRFAP